MLDTSKYYNPKESIMWMSLLNENYYLSKRRFRTCSSFIDRDFFDDFANYLEATVSIPVLEELVISNKIFLEIDKIRERKNDY